MTLSTGRDTSMLIPFGLDQVCTNLNAVARLLVEDSRFRLACEFPSTSRNMDPPEFQFASKLAAPVIAARDQPTVRFLLTPHRIDFWLGSIETSRSNRSLRQSFTFHFVVVASN